MSCCRCDDREETDPHWMYTTLLARYEDKTRALERELVKRKVDDKVLERVGSLSFALAKLLDVSRSAIEAGDWKIDGACDPDSVIRHAVYTLNQAGGDPNG